jgi:hypothetical protein
MPHACARALGSARRNRGRARQRRSRRRERTARLHDCRPTGLRRPREPRARAHRHPQRGIRLPERAHHGEPCARRSAQGRRLVRSADRARNSHGHRVRPEGTVGNLRSRRRAGARRPDPAGPRRARGESDVSPEGHRHAGRALRQRGGGGRRRRHRRDRGGHSSRRRRPAQRRAVVVTSGAAGGAHRFRRPRPRRRARAGARQARARDLGRRWTQCSAGVVDSTDSRIP